MENKLRPFEMTPAHECLSRFNTSGENSHCPYPYGSVTMPLFMCPNCEGVYLEKVTECDCTVGEYPKWIEGVGVFPSQSAKMSRKVRNERS